MSLHESGQMYLEAIHILSQQAPYVRSIDVGEYLGYSKPSVSRAMSILKRDGYVRVNEDGHLFLTDEGQRVAETMYKRHTVLTTFLQALGVDKETAAEDACRIEHVISECSFDAITRHMEQLPKEHINHEI
ncbi:MAG: metal-dependent transcriptional regulator [Oscillospiraceae bacterium]|nr:metal-dependent transcriptional regulator [Oscillospiraceae bacterium]